MNSIKRYSLAATVLAAVLFTPRLADAAILIVVDISNPSATTFTATGAAPLIDDFSSGTTFGVSLLGLFSSDYDASSQTVSGNLIPSGSPIPYDSVLNDFFNLTGLDINLFATDDESQTFLTGTPAFTGTALIDLSGATFGTSGNIIVGDSEFGSGNIIGQWSAIPEPSSYAILIALATGCLLIVRHRRS